MRLRNCLLPIPIHILTSLIQYCNVNYRNPKTTIFKWRLYMQISQKLLYHYKVAWIYKLTLFKTSTVKLQRTELRCSSRPVGKEEEKWEKEEDEEYWSRSVWKLLDPIPHHPLFVPQRYWKEQRGCSINCSRKRNIKCECWLIC